MTSAPPMKRLHLVTDDDVLADADFAAKAAAVMEACGRDVALHIRGHGTHASVLERIGEEASAAAIRTGAWLLVNDRIDVAMAVRANGVQLGAASLDIADARLLLGHGAIIGYSAHGVLESLQAAADGADFVLAGTIWRSASHADRPPAGTGMLRDCAQRVLKPVIAIGGVTPERVAEAAAAGAYGVAALGGVWHASDCAAAAATYLESIRAAYGSDMLQEQTQ
jgi:thiamine-phosphate pyrophosphorylase